MPSITLRVSRETSRLFDVKTSCGDAEKVQLQKRRPRRPVQESSASVAGIFLPRHAPDARNLRRNLQPVPRPPTSIVARSTLDYHQGPRV
ncbi:MAG: hypothetical protein N2C14_08870 [Planctomycetales bacterium]